MPDRIDWTAAYRELRTAVSQAGLLRPDPAAYVQIGLACCCLIIGALGLAALLPHTALSALACALVGGFALVQVALLGHDAAHRSVARRPGANRLLGYVCWSLVLGVGFAFWRREHNAHHGRPNDPAADPALQTGGLIALYDEAARTRPAWLRALGAQQVVLYTLALPFVLLALRVRGWGFTLRALGGRRRWIDAGLLALNALATLAPPLVLGAWWAGVLLGTQLVAGIYLGLVFAPHHKGMPVWAAGQRLSYVQRQVLTARNVRSHPLNDMLFGGLNYQIEHHLFPTMPRSRLRRARAIVRPFCLAHGLPYEDVPALVSYRRVYAELARLGSLAS